MDDYQLIDQELRRLTAQGWQVASMSDHSAQVMQPHAVSGVGIALLVFTPVVLGMLAALVNALWGSALFSLALAFAALLALEHIGHRPSLIYITAEQLRNPTPATAVRAPNGITVCSKCYRPIRGDASACPGCQAQFVKA